MIYGPYPGTYVNADNTQIIFIDKNWLYPVITFGRFISVRDPEGHAHQYPHCGLIEDTFERQFHRVA